MDKSQSTPYVNRVEFQQINTDGHTTGQYFLKIDFDFKVLYQILVLEDGGVRTGMHVIIILTIKE